MKNRIKNTLLKVAKSVYKNEPTGHDFGHIKRVLKYCKMINRQENGDWNIIFVSALFHDVHRVIQFQKRIFVTPEEAMPEVKKILDKYKGYFTQKEYDKVITNIRLHEDKDIKYDKKNIELAVLQDADLLDSLGKNGLRRTMKYCRYHNIPFYDPESLESLDYVVNIHPISTSHFVYRTLIPEYDILKTESAKKIAGKDKKLLYKFIEKQREIYNKSSFKK